MSASVSLLRSRRSKVADKDEDSDEESDCSIKDLQKKESIEQGARAIAAINMLTVSMVNQLLEKRGLDPFGKTLNSSSCDAETSWSSPLKNTPSRSSVVQSIKENTLGKSRKSVRFTPDNSRNEYSPDPRCDVEQGDLPHRIATPVSALRMEPKFTPIRRSKVLKANLLRSLENEHDISLMENFGCSSDIFDRPLPIRDLITSENANNETVERTPLQAMPTENQTLVLQSKVSSAVPPATKTEKTTNPLTTPDVPCAEETLLKAEDNVTDVTVLTEVESEDVNKDESQFETPIKSKWCHYFDPTSPEHMSPFLKRLLEERAEKNKGDESMRSSSSDTDGLEDQPRLSVLKGVVAYVEVRREDEDRSPGFRWKLKELGAQVEEKFTKKVTHVVFQEGLLSTFRKAKESSNVHLVSAVWVMACDESSQRVPEEKYPIDEEDKYSTLAPLKKYIRRPQVLSPDLGDGYDEKRLAKRLQRMKRRSMKLEGTPNADKAGSTNSLKTSSPEGQTPLKSTKSSTAKHKAGASKNGSSSLMTAWLAGKKSPDAARQSPDSPPAKSAPELNPSSKNSPKKTSRYSRLFERPETNTSVPESSPVKTSPAKEPAKAKRSPAKSVVLPRSERVVSKSFELPRTSSSASNSKSKMTSPGKEQVKSKRSPAKSVKSVTTTAVDSPRKRGRVSKSFELPASSSSVLSEKISPIKEPVKKKQSPAKSVSAAAVESPRKRGKCDTSSMVSETASVKETVTTKRLASKPLSASVAVDLPRKKLRYSRSFEKAAVESEKTKRSSDKSARQVIETAPIAVASPRKRGRYSTLADIPEASSSVPDTDSGKTSPGKNPVEKKSSPAKCVKSVTISAVGSSRKKGRCSKLFVIPETNSCVPDVTCGTVSPVKLEPTKPRRTPSKSAKSDIPTDVDRPREGKYLRSSVTPLKSTLESEPTEKKLSPAKSAQSALVPELNVDPPKRKRRFSRLFDAPEPTSSAPDLLSEEVSTTKETETIMKKSPTKPAPPPKADKSSLTKTERLANLLSQLFDDEKESEGILENLLHSDNKIDAKVEGRSLAEAGGNHSKSLKKPKGKEGLKATVQQTTFKKSVKKPVVKGSLASWLTTNKGKSANQVLESASKISALPVSFKERKLPVVGVSPSEKSVSTVSKSARPSSSRIPPNKRLRFVPPLKKNDSLRSSSKSESSKNNRTPPSDTGKGSVKGQTLLTSHFRAVDVVEKKVENGEVTQQDFQTEKTSNDKGDVAMGKNFENMEETQQAVLTEKASDDKSDVAMEKNVENVDVTQQAVLTEKASDDTSDVVMEKNVENVDVTQQAVLTEKASDDKSDVAMEKNVENVDVTQQAVLTEKVSDDKSDVVMEKNVENMEETQQAVLTEKASDDKSDPSEKLLNKITPVLADVEDQRTFLQSRAEDDAERAQPSCAVSTAFPSLNSENQNAVGPLTSEEKGVLPSSNPVGDSLVQPICEELKVLYEGNSEPTPPITGINDGSSDLQTLRDTDKNELQVSSTVDENSPLPPTAEAIGESSLFTTPSVQDESAPLPLGSEKDDVPSSRPDDGAVVQLSNLEDERSSHQKSAEENEALAPSFCTASFVP